MSAIVFDLDGTLIDSAPDIRIIANTVLATQALPPLTMAQTRGFIGHGAGHFVAQMMAANGFDRASAEFDATHTRMLAEFTSLYETTFEATTLYPGVQDALDTLAGLGYRLGLCTNKPVSATIAVLKHFGLHDKFTAVVGGDTLTVKKPDPAPLDLAFDKLGVGVHAYVGDSEVDADTAQAAGVPFALFTEGYRKSPVDALPHMIRFDDFTALPGMMQRLKGAA